jgi:hypothetical protein
MKKIWFNKEKTVSMFQLFDHIFVCFLRIIRLCDQNNFKDTLGQTLHVNICMVFFTLELGWNYEQHVFYMKTIYFMFYNKMRYIPAIYLNSLRLKGSK